MHLLRFALVGSAIVLSACSPSTRDHGPSKEGSGPTEPGPRKAPVPAPKLQPIRTLEVDLDQLAGGVFVPGAYVLTGNATAFELPGAFPGKIAHLAGDKLAVVEGRLAADAPMRFVREGDHLRAVSFDGATAYLAVERVTAAAPWSATAASSGCCAWWEHTLWRAAPGAPAAGLLRVVTPPSLAWSVIDFQQPRTLQPRWRVLLSDGKGAAVAAAVSPKADQLVLVVAAPDGSASLQARRVSDGTLVWSAALGAAAAEWRRGDGRIAYSQDGARIAVLVEDPKRCEACTAIDVRSSAGGDRLHRVALETVIAPRFSTLALTGDTAWVFEHVPASTTDLATRPERCQYEARALATNQRRPRPPADWGLGDCTVWAMAPRFDAPGVMMLARRGSKLLWLAAADAP